MDTLDSETIKLLQIQMHVSQIVYDQKLSKLIMQFFKQQTNNDNVSTHQHCNCSQSSCHFQVHKIVQYHLQISPGFLFEQLPVDYQQCRYFSIVHPHDGTVINQAALQFSDFLFDDQPYHQHYFLAVDQSKQSGVYYGRQCSPLEEGTACHKLPSLSSFSNK